jgi:hypothetical protein
VYACDVAEERRLELLIRESSKGRPPICGVIQSAMVLKVSSVPVPLQVGILTTNRITCSRR